MKCIVLLLPDISSRSLQFIYCMTKASFCYYNIVADWMSVASGDLDKINSLEDHSIALVSERNIHREIN